MSKNNDSFGNTKGWAAVSQSLGEGLPVILSVLSQRFKATWFATSKIRPFPQIFH
jgi:hypothetical protein